MDIAFPDTYLYYEKVALHSKEYRDFTERLRTARLESGLTQVQVAKKLKRPQSYVSNIESGQQRVVTPEAGPLTPETGPPEKLILAVYAAVVEIQEVAVLQ